LASKKYEMSPVVPPANRICAKVGSCQMTSGRGSVATPGGGSSQTGFSGSP
jgi:hypothetical protein